MMWLEALLASFLLLAAAALSLQAAPPQEPLLDLAAYQQLQDKAALLSLARNTGSGIFSSDDAFCYRGQWSMQPGTYFYSQASCAQSGTVPSSGAHASVQIRSVHYGVWKDGQLQFLTLEQYVKTN